MNHIARLLIYTIIPIVKKCRFLSLSHSDFGGFSFYEISWRTGLMPRPFQLFFIRGESYLWLIYAILQDRNLSDQKVFLQWSTATETTTTINNNSQLQYLSIVVIDGFRIKSFFSFTLKPRLLVNWFAFSFFTATNFWTIYYFLGKPIYPKLAFSGY